jgi:signal transduction histidine kinase
VFPQRRGIVEDFPELIAAPYVFLYIVSAVEIEAAYGGSPVSTGLALRLLLVCVGLAGCLLAMSCYYAARESQSHLARGQARVFLAGIALLSLPVSLVWLLGSPGALLASVTLLAALLPFPVGYAISRYEVYDLDFSMRSLAAQGLYLSLWAGGFFLALQLLQDRLAIPDVFRHPTVMFATIYGVLVPLDALRSRIKRQLRALMISQRFDWDRLGREFAHKIAAARSSEGVARAVCDAVRSGLSGAGVATFVAHGERLQVGHAVGARSFEDPERVLQLAEWTREAVEDLNRLDETEGPAKEAYDSGVGAVAKIASGQTLLGCIVVFPNKRGRLLGASEKLWIATLAGHAASALAAMRLEQELRVAERFAARGRIEAELAHEIGKPLGVLELTAQKLAAQIDPVDPLVPYLKKIASLAAQARMLTRAALESEPGKSRAKLEDIVQRACLEVRSLHGEAHILVHQLPDLGELPEGYDRLVRVLVNLLDNSLRASEADGVVELRARASLASLELVIEDRGAGMSQEQLRRAFEAFASFRTGGTGLGLSISRQAVALLGGVLELEPRRDGAGMRAVVSVPR